MVAVLALLGVLAVLFAAAVLATRDSAPLADAQRDAADVALPKRALKPANVGRLRFSLAARGYRMSEVDAALARLADELADRDPKIVEIKGSGSGRTKGSAAVASPPPVPTPAAVPTAAPDPLPPADLGSELVTEVSPQQVNPQQPRQQ